MSRNLVVFVVTGLLSIVVQARTADAQTPSSPATVSLALNPDILFDYDVFAAKDEPRYGWYLIYRFNDGSSIQNGPYGSYNQAAYRLWFNAEHNIHASAVDGEIVERQLPPAWQFVQRFDGSADASALASLLQQFGLLTDIRRISTLRLSPSPTR